MRVRNKGTRQMFNDIRGSLSDIVKICEITFVANVSKGEWFRILGMTSIIGILGDPEICNVVQSESWL